MTAIWTYPWSLYTEGVATACRDLAGRGIDTLNVASHYHSVRTMQPRFPESLFDSYPGGCYFDPDGSYFEATPIRPHVNEVRDTGDSLAEIGDVAADHGLDVAAWVVCFHNTRLASAYPSYRLESAFGDPCEHAFCPSRAEVRNYFSGIVRSLADREVAEIQLETIGYQRVFHDHGAAFGHDKRQVLTGPAETILLSQCFCDGCRAAAQDRGVDIDRARRLVRDILQDSFETPHSDPMSLDALVHEHRTLRDLFEFRSGVVDEFVAELADASGSVPLNYYVFEPGLGSDPGSGWPAGVRLSSVEEHLDRVTALCYVSDPTVATDRIRTLSRSVDLPVDAGITLDPELIESEAELAALVDAIRDATDGTLNVYHHGLVTETQLDWIANVV